MTLEQAIENRAKAIPLIAETVGERVSWDLRIEREPAITMQIISDPRPQHFKGFQPLRPTSVQIDVWSDDPAEAAALREALIAGLVVPAEIGRIRFQRATIQSVRGGGQSNTAGQQNFRDQIARESIDILFLHNA
jgi:hypothetical protein